MKCTREARRKFANSVYYIVNAREALEKLSFYAYFDKKCQNTSAWIWHAVLLRQKIVRETFDIVSPCPPRRRLTPMPPTYETCNATFVAPWPRWVSHAIVHVLFPSLLSLSPLFLLLSPFPLFFPSFCIFSPIAPLPPCSAAPDSTDYHYQSMFKNLCHQVYPKGFWTSVAAFEHGW